MLLLVTRYGNVVSVGVPDATTVSAVNKRHRFPTLNCRTLFYMIPMSLVIGAYAYLD